MAPPHRVRVLSSYIYGQENVPHREMGRVNRWFHGFVKSLTRNGSSVSQLDLEFVRLPHPSAMGAISERFNRQAVQLVICAGTDAVLRWSAVERGIPTLYFGAHPENNGLEVITQGNVSGVRLNLPLIWSFENFSLLKELLPNVRDVFIPLNLRSEFAFPGVRANYELSRRQRRGSWITAPSSRLGYRSVYFLASRLGCQYHEGPFGDLTELESLLREVPPGTTSALVGFNDFILLDGALDILLGVVRARNLPLFWINNVPIVRTGGIADFSSDFEKVGERLGEMSLQILRDEVPVSAIPFADDPGERFSLNLERCRELGITAGEEVRKRFHSVLAVVAGDALTLDATASVRPGRT
jgi:ABC-type uncharacterized transport system substrate-binding protein